MRKKILFLTGTRAEFGKLKSLISILQKNDKFEIHIFATGMHMHNKYGYTVREIEKAGFKNIFKYINYTSESSMDLTLAKTIEGFSSYIREEPPDMIVIHGDRCEALAGAIVGSLNNIYVAHIEGGEVSGTIDESIRHAISKLSHIHFVSNKNAKARLVQMGENRESIFVIGSPDLDIMFSENLPNIVNVKDYYEIKYQKYAIVMFHPVTTEYKYINEYAENLANALLEDNQNYVVIYPNNDMGSEKILDAFKVFDSNPRFKIFPSLRFEFFLVLLKNSQFIIGNSSAGIGEAPYYGIQCINVGTRQNNRNLNKEIINCGYEKEEIKEAINLVKSLSNYIPQVLSGNGNSCNMFQSTLESDKLWLIPKQKAFNDLSI